VGQALAAILGRHRQAHPAAARIGVVGGLEALGGDHRAVLAARAALLVARKIQGRQHLLAELGALLEDRPDDVGRRVREARQVVVPLEPEHVVEEEQDVLHGCLVARHGTPSPTLVRGCAATR
jgi:hypothetical protein